MRALGLDLGASGVRAFSEPNASPVAHITGAAGAATRDLDTRNMIRAVALKLGQTQYDTVCLGLSGFTSLQVDVADLASVIAEQWNSATVLVTSDMVTSHYSHFEEQTGVIAVVGTGALIFGISHAVHARVDGLGASLGDWGSAHWVGHQALRRAHRQAELTGTSALLDALVTNLGPQATWPVRLASQDIDTFQIAQLAQVVRRVSDAGDRLAADILEEAGRLAGESALRCANQVSEETVAFGGGILGEENVLAVAAFVDTVESGGYTVEPMKSTPGVGAWSLATASRSDRIDYLENNGMLYRKPPHQ